MSRPLLAPHADAYAATGSADLVEVPADAEDGRERKGLVCGMRHGWQVGGYASAMAAMPGGLSCLRLVWRMVCPATEKNSLTVAAAWPG